MITGNKIHNQGEDECHVKLPSPNKRQTAPRSSHQRIAETHAACHWAWRERGTPADTEIWGAVGRQTPTVPGRQRYDGILNVLTIQKIESKVKSFSEYSVGCKQLWELSASQPWAKRSAQVRMKRWAWNGDGPPTVCRAFPGLLPGALLAPRWGKCSELHVRPGRQAMLSSTSSCHSPVTEQSVS